MPAAGACGSGIIAADLGAAEDERGKCDGEDERASFHDLTPGWRVWGFGVRPEPARLIRSEPNALGAHLPGGFGNLPAQELGRVSAVTFLATVTALPAIGMFTGPGPNFTSANAALTLP